MDSLEQEQKPGEQEQPSSEQEQVETTSKEPKPTLGERVYKESEFKKAQSAWDRQLSMQKTEATKAKTDAERAAKKSERLESDLQSLQKELDNLATKQFADDPEARQAYIDRHSLAKERREIELAKRESEDKLYESEKLAWQVKMDRRADELRKEYGISLEDLSGSLSEEEMEVRALKYQLNKPKPEESPIQKFDSHLSTGIGGKLSQDAQRKLSDEEWFKAKKGGRID